ncbi:MAG: PQQ-binding-like beta-propeller repeat protein, partial [Planctomycetes bacterium]|nr:PQQ-binding-like beta-propeller repeat protein [Planctomycetota bacterium]
IALAPAGAFRVEAEDPVERRLERDADPNPAAFPAVTPEDWPTYRGGNARTASTPVAVSANPQPLWAYRPGAAYLPSAPAAAGDLVFVGGDDGSVRAIDARSGREAWRAQTGGDIPVSPTVWEGRVLVGSGDGFVYAFEAATGRRLWRFRAAPVERRILVHDRIGSTWPVGSGIIVADGIAYAVAGIADYDGTYVCALDAATGAPRWRNTTSGHLDPELRKGVSAQGILTIAGGRLWMPGGNVISPACYRLDDGACLSRAVGDGSPRANRGEEIGVLKHGILVFGGRLRFSSTRNVVNPGNFVVAAIGPEVLAASAPLGSGKIAPAWSASILVIANGPFSTPVAFDISAIEKHLASPGGGSGDPAVLRRALARGPARKWVAQELQGNDPVAFAIAANVVLAAVEVPHPGSRFPGWELASLDPETGKVMGRIRLPGLPRAGGLAITRHGRIIIAFEDGSIGAYGRP